MLVHSSLSSTISRGMELAIIKFVCLSVLMSLQMVTSSSKVIKKIDSHMAKQGTTTQGVLWSRLHPTPATKTRHNVSDWRRITNDPTNEVLVRIFSRNKYFLEITSSGKIRGTRHGRSKFVKLIMQAVGTGIVRIKGQATQKYLAMNAYGVLYATQTLNKECLFKEKREHSGFQTFSSYIYSGSNKSNNQNKELYVAIKKNGKQRHGINTAKRQRAIQFLVLHRKKL